jgi:streptogramin lyase
MRRGIRRSAAAALPALFVGAALLVFAQPAAAKPRLAGVFDVSGTPGRIAVGAKGSAWVVLSGSSEGNELAKITPNGTVREFDLGAIAPTGIAIGPDGDIWLTRAGGVTEVDGDNPAGVTDHAIGAIGAPQEITRGPGGRLWTASGDQLVSFHPGNPAGFATRSLGANTSARGIAAGAGKVWVADFNDGKILRVKPGGAIKRFHVGGGPQDVAAGPKRRVAYTNQGTNPHTIGRIVGRRVLRKRVPGTDPFGIEFAAGRWWIANFASHDLSVLSPKGKLRRFRRLPANSGPRFVARGKKRTLWVALEAAQKVARISGL